MVGRGGSGGNCDWPASFPPIRENASFRVRLSLPVCHLFHQTKPQREVPLAEQGNPAIQRDFGASIKGRSHRLLLCGEDTRRQTHRQQLSLSPSKLHATYAVRNTAATYQLRPTTTTAGSLAWPCRRHRRARAPLGWGERKERRGDKTHRTYRHTSTDRMIRSTQIARLDGLMLCASVDDEETEAALAEIKSQVKLVLRRLNRNSEPQASIESGPYTLHYQMAAGDVVFFCICERSYPRKLAFTYLADLAAEFSNTYPAAQVTSATLRPYAFMDFDTFISRTKATYSDARAAQNLDKLNDELRDVTKVMTKNIEDLLYRGDSLERMGELSSRLRDDSKKYRRAAVRINWELMLKQYGPFAALFLIIFVFVWWRFF